MEARSGVLVGLILAAALLGLIPAAIARSKRRSFFGWWIFGFLLFLPALICAVLIAPMPPRPRSFITCQQCGRNSSSSSNICAHCGQPARGSVAVLVPQHSPATVEPTSDPLRDLERFGRLRRDGHLSDEEYEAVKRRLLDQT